MHAETQGPPAGEADPTQSERRLSEIATRQHGVIARRQLVQLGFGRGAIAHRLKLGRLHRVHRGVYAVGHRTLTRYGRWMAAVLACGKDALLSHRSAAAHWGLMRFRAGPIEVISAHGSGREGIVLHRHRIDSQDRAVKGGIPVTSVARTLLDVAEVVDARRFERMAEEADRLGHLHMQELERVCERGVGRRGLGVCRRLIADAKVPEFSASSLEGFFADFCREHSLPSPVHNALVLDREVDAFWPEQGVMVELDSFEFHKHRAAFEDDRARDAAMQAAGYRVIRITHRRMENDGGRVAAQLRKLLGIGPDGNGPK